MEANCTDACPLERGQKAVPNHVVWVEDSAGFRRKNKIPSDTQLPNGEGFQEPRVPQFQQRSSQLSRHVDPPRPTALWRCEPAIDIVAPYLDETAASGLIGAKLNVTPLERHNLAAPKPRPQATILELVDLQGQRSGSFNPRRRARDGKGVGGVCE